MPFVQWSAAFPSSCGLSATLRLSGSVALWCSLSFGFPDSITAYPGVLTISQAALSYIHILFSSLLPELCHCIHGGLLLYLLSILHNRTDSSAVLEDYQPLIWVVIIWTTSKGMFPLIRMLSLERLHPDIIIYLEVAVLGNLWKALLCSSSLPFSLSSSLINKQKTERKRSRLCSRNTCVLIVLIWSSVTPNKSGNGNCP